MSQIRRWRSQCRYRATLRALRRLSMRQLTELWIPPSDIPRLARAATAE